MTVIIFEDDTWEAFGPTAETRHLSQLGWGTRTLMESVAAIFPKEEIRLWGRPHLAEVTELEVKKGYNGKADPADIFVNARARPDLIPKEKLTQKKKVAVMSEGALVAASGASAKPGVIPRRASAAHAKSVEVLEMPERAVFRGSWDLVGSNGLAIAEQVGSGNVASRISRSVSVKGSAARLRADESAQIEDHVVLDLSAGPIVLEEGTVVEAFSRLSGPCFIGRSTKVRSALVRGGTSIFENCRIGGEVENSIVMSFTNKSHFGYVGDSIVGEWVNIGAGGTFSNLKNTYGYVRVKVGEKRVETGKVMLGPAVGDMAKLSIGSLVYSGKKVGTGSQVGGAVQDDVPPFSYLDGQSGKRRELDVESLIETQKRMMERRGKTLTKQRESLIRNLHATSAALRRREGYRKGPI